MDGRREDDLRLYERVAVLEASIPRLEKQLIEARDDIKELLALANRSKGAMFTVMSMSAAIGGVVTWGLGHFLGGGK